MTVPSVLVTTAPTGTDPFCADSHAHSNAVRHGGQDEPPGEGEIALPRDQSLTGEAHGDERVEEVDEQRAIGVDAQGRAAWIRGEVRRQPIRKRRHHEHAEGLGRLDGDTLGEDPVDAEGEVGVLLDRTERDHEPVLVLEVLLDLHPVAVLDLHRSTSS